MRYEKVDRPKLLDWARRKKKLPERPDGTQTFGPFDIMSATYEVRYDGPTDTWELGLLLDTTAEEYLARRGPIVQLATEHRGQMPPKEFMQMLIQAAIGSGLTKLADILNTVELAANLEAVEQSYRTNEDYTAIPTEFDEAAIRKVLANGRGRDPAKHLWWVDEHKVYHLH